eukprot:353925-Chlamydomonas_euryale.AAC.11
MSSPLEPSPPLPTNASQQTSQAADAIAAAWRDGVTRQVIELQLPLIGATDLDDWCVPCGNVEVWGWWRDGVTRQASSSSSL